MTKFFQREFNSHGNVGQLYDDFDQMLQSGNLKKGEWIGLKTEKFITLERSNYTKEIVKYEHNIIESL